jgi:hypothetical protein
VRSSEFWELIDATFGARGRLIVRDHVLTVLGGVTASEALGRGDDPRRVWQALCDDFEIPEQRRWLGDPGRR